MSKQQRDALDQLSRHAPLDVGGDVQEQRVIFEKMIASIPLPADVVATPGTLGGIPVVNVDVAGVESDDVIFYLHGGAYCIGSAAASVGLASDGPAPARSRSTTGSRQRTPTRPRSTTRWPRTGRCLRACPPPGSRSWASRRAEG
jgi:hypothetical protein